jgi:hypothetical protein
MSLKKEIDDNYIYFDDEGNPQIALPKNWVSKEEAMKMFPLENARKKDKIYIDNYNNEKR